MKATIMSSCFNIISPVPGIQKILPLPRQSAGIAFVLLVVTTTAPVPQATQHHLSSMILYIENPKDSTRKLLGLINEYSKVAGYKINTEIPCIPIY